MATPLSRATPLKALGTLHNRAATLHSRAPTSHSSSREGTTHHLSRSVEWAPFALQRESDYSAAAPGDWAAAVLTWHSLQYSIMHCLWQVGCTEALTGCDWTVPPLLLYSNSLTAT